MTTLHDRLADLADEAPLGSPPSDLWTSGRRLHRRKRAGTAIIVVASLALLVGLGGLTWSRSRVHVEPAGVETELGMPSQIWQADPHLPGTGDTGPIGPLVAAVPTPRDSWFGDSSNGILGISATGEYAFLDVPHLASEPPDAAPAVSADGRYVAYWRTGRPSGSAGVLAGEESVTGVAAYDTVTGQVHEYDVATEHGLMPQNLLWADGVLWFDVWQYDEARDDGTSSSRTHVVAWDPSADQDHIWTQNPPDLSVASAWGDSVVGTNRLGYVRRSTADGDREALGRITGAPNLTAPLFVAEDGTDAVTQSQIDDPQDQRGPLFVTRLGTTGSDELTLTEVPETTEVPVDALLGWRDDRHVVAYEYGRGTGEGRFRLVDVRTGESSTLGYAEGNQPVMAADALAGPVFDAPAPPTPPDPRLVYGGVAAILLTAGLALVLWRRRAVR